MFAVGGMLVFSKVMPDDPARAYYAPYGCGMGFISFGCAMWALFQQLTTR